MRNAIFPSFSTCLDNFGTTEAKMSNLNSFSSGLLQDLHQSLTPLPINRNLSWLHEFNYPSVGGREFVPTSYENPSNRSYCTRNSHDQDVAENSQKRTDCSGINDQKSSFNAAKKRKILDIEYPHHQGSQTPAMAEQPKAPVRRSQKLGDRVTALQQLVSPFGKTDTASVLQEATVYIKFLQEQIQVLTSPYFKDDEKVERANLTSRGLSLVPVSSTLNLARGAGNRSL